jgi:hypothetical protein
VASIQVLHIKRFTNNLPGGFCVVYFQVKWVANNGPAVTFGCQAAIVAFFIISIIATQLKGASWRAKFPAPTTSRNY